MTTQEYEMAPESAHVSEARKPTPAEARAQARYIKANYAGVIDCRVARETGRVVTLYNGEAQGLDGNYSLVCEDHHWTLSVSTVKLGLLHLSNPLDWCEECNGVAAEQRARYGQHDE